MNLRHVERGTKLKIYEEMQQRAVSDEYEATLKYLENDRVIVANCPRLYDNFDKLNLGVRLNISFISGIHTYSFIGIPIEKLRSKGHVMIEQFSDLVAISQRQFDRDEMRVTVEVYGIPEAVATGSTFTKPDVAPDLVDLSFDVSSGGLCVVTNTLLTSKHDPFYLVGFDLTQKYSFLLPAKLVRKSNYPRTKIGKYDYGFCFLFDNLPEEKARLTRAILNKKIQSV